jgi:hypothetical protein
MEGYLLFIITIMYAELSLCPVVRNVGRVLFYTHTLAILTPLYAPTVGIGMLEGGMIYLMGFITCAEISDTRRSKIIFYVMAMMTSYIYLSVYYKTFTEILIFGYDVMGHSDSIFRWGVLMALGSCSLDLDKGGDILRRDIELSIGGLLLFMIMP